MSNRALQKSTTGDANKKDAAKEEAEELARGEEALK